MEMITKPFYGDTWGSSHNHFGSAVFMLNDITESIRPHLMSGKPFRVIMDCDPESADGFRISVTEFEPGSTDLGFHKRTDLPPHLRRTPIPTDFAQGVPRHKCAQAETLELPHRPERD